jgi:hypothetical protein
MISLSVDASQFAAVTAVLEKHKQIPVEHILDEAGAALLNRNRERFLAKKNPDNVPWIPSDAGMLREMAGGPGTLFDTGKLFDSIQLHSDGPNDRSISSAVDYDKYLVSSPKPDKRWPFLGFNDNDSMIFKDIVVRRVNEALQD